MSSTGCSNPDMATVLRARAPFLDDRAVARLEEYAALLVRWNRTINLIGRHAGAAIRDRHFLDCLAVAPFMPTGPCTVLDIGAGAGFPGLVLAIARPDARVTLAEPRRKRQAFLRQVIRSLGLSNVRVVGEHLRADDPAQIERVGRHDCVTSRALTDLAGFLDLALPYCKSGGSIIAMKGPAGKEELDQWRRQGGDLPAHLHPYSLPDGSRRLLVVVENP